MPNPPNLMPPRDDALAVLPHQFSQGMHQFGLLIFEPLVVGGQGLAIPRHPWRQYPAGYLRLRQRRPNPPAGMPALRQPNNSRRPVQENQALSF